MQDILFYLHIGSLCVAGLGVLYADHAAFDWWRGKTNVIAHRTLHIAHWTVTLGLAALITTGLFLFWPMRDYLVAQPLFWLKMTFVAALVVNSFVIETLMHVTTRAPYRALTRRQKIPLFISGAISACCWLGAFLVAITLF